MWLHNLPTNLQRMIHSDSVKCTTCLVKAKHYAAVVQSHRAGERSVPNAPDGFAGKEGIYKCSGWDLLVLPRTDNENPQASLACTNSVFDLKQLSVCRHDHLYHDDKMTNHAAANGFWAGFIYMYACVQC